MKLRAILIDAVARTVTEAVVTEHRDIPRLIGAEMICSGGRNRDKNGREIIFVDDVGHYTEKPAFLLPSFYPDLLIGNGLILGLEGPESVDAISTIEEIEAGITWLGPT
jgi:hypothetical protein